MISNVQFGNFLLHRDETRTFRQLFIFYLYSAK